jgi:hypothetical protein
MNTCQKTVSKKESVKECESVFVCVRVSEGEFCVDYGCSNGKPRPLTNQEGGKRKMSVFSLVSIVTSKTGY